MVSFLASHGYPDCPQSTSTSQHYEPTTEELIGGNTLQRLVKPFNMLILLE